MFSFKDTFDLLIHPKSAEGKHVLEGVDEEIREFISFCPEIDNPERTVMVKTTTKFNIENLNRVNEFGRRLQNIVNLKRANDILALNNFLCAVNQQLEIGGHYIGCVETSVLRNRRLVKKYPFPFNYAYLFGDFIFKRVFPKLPVLSKLYFRLTAGRNRVMTQVEILGRLCFCGFSIIETKVIDKYLVFVVKKVEEAEHRAEKRYGPLLTMVRVGHKGIPIKVFKLRTMHAYSEYLQDYIYEKNALDVGGKFKDDFRITPIGKILRKIWLDELPMAINWLKGEIKIVGVRPLSMQYLSLYPKEFQKIRNEIKPGLIPPYYADMPENIEEIVASERRYIDAYKKAPFSTDVKYLIKALKNIFLEKARSK